MILSQLKPAGGERPQIGRCSFEGATFTEAAYFSHVDFTDHTSFKNARFLSSAYFEHVDMKEGGAFTGIEASSDISFVNSTFRESTWFDGARFHGPAHFLWATFHNFFSLEGAYFKEGVDFHEAEFRDYLEPGPFKVDGELEFNLVKFHSSMTMEVAAARINMAGAHWTLPGRLHVRHAEIDLSECVLEAPLSLATRPKLFTSERHGTLTEESFSEGNHSAALRDLYGTDCAMLTLADLDLTQCTFDGAFHLDQLRLEGRGKFNAPPSGRHWRRGLPFKWTQRQVIEEERRWRALPGRPPHLRRGWGPAPENEHDVPGLTSLITIYRQLRKAREDAKDEPGAADFYYGEMEMRRHSLCWRKAERWLLQAYWLLSGYGLRASRALGWLALAMMTTMLLMMGFGLPQDLPKQQATGTVSPRGKVAFEIDQGDPRNPTKNRFTSQRFEKSLRVTLNSVVFRSSGQDLTTVGHYVEMASRFSEPLLLGLAALAIRGRVKR
ncbi:pentapeptide repeat-containing protein [Streptomyces bluensis]|uniref:pentapeptide repeat-containing protein n=1 Tax=Streptomyces bluensis TaxID=33897 RepID=UPI0036B53233